MEAKNSITLTWCEKHTNWWVTNCPDCMLDANEESIKREAIREVAEWVNSHIVFAFPYAKIEWQEWQARLKRWGIA